jgi:phosphoglycolate phosphatase
LTDSFPGISRCINYALTELGRDRVSEDLFRTRVGTPLASLFGRLMQTEDPELINRAVVAYRSRFDRIGFLENSLYPGVVEALEQFQRWGHSLEIVTVKPTPAARRVAAHFGIDRYFATIHGSDLEAPHRTKADLLRSIVHAGERAHAVMIGDHTDDVAAARSTGVRAVAVGWGYGRASDLRAALPDYFAETVLDLVNCVRIGG